MYAKIARSEPKSMILNIEGRSIMYTIHTFLLSGFYRKLFLGSVIN